MKGWLCGGLSKLFSKKDAIVQYPKISDNDLSVAYPKSAAEMVAARATGQQATNKIQENLVRKDPIKTTILDEVRKDYFKVGLGKPNSVIRKIQKSDYAETVEDYKNKSEKWLDQDFEYVLTKDIVAYKRVEDVLKNKGITPTFMSNPISPHSIVQGGFCNCYFLTALASLSEKEYRAKNLFGCPLEINKNGIYMAKFLFDGIYQQVVVDDLFPVRADGRFVGSSPIIVGNNADIWVMILEKCWAKLVRGYEFINNRWNQQSLFAVTGAPVFTRILNYVTEQEFKTKLFKDCLASYQNNGILTCGTGEINKNEGLKQGHSYSVLGVFELKDKRILQLRNPWGDCEWTAKYSDHDVSFWNSLSKEEKDAINFRYNINDNDGVFYMDWQDFYTRYAAISFCQIDDNAHYYYSNKEYDHEKPQYYSLQTSKQDEELPIYITLSQPTQFNHANFSDIRYSNITVMITKIGHLPNNERTYEYVGTYSYYTRISSNNFYLPCYKFPGGRYTFRVVVSHPYKLTTRVTIGSYSRKQFGIKPLFNVDDNEFVSNSFFSHDKQRNDKLISENKEIAYLDGDKAAWVTEYFQEEGNMGYYLLHVKKQSQFRYRITFSQDMNKDLVFLGAHRNQKSFNEICEKGSQVIIVYTYTTGRPESYEYLKGLPFEDQRVRPYPSIQKIY